MCADASRKTAPSRPSASSAGADPAAPPATRSARSVSIVITIRSCGGIGRVPARMQAAHDRAVHRTTTEPRRADIILPLGTTTTIDVALAVASVSETVQVTAETPVIDIKSSASNTQLSEALLQNLPTGRFQPDIINLTPGVNSQVAYGGSQNS